MVLKVFGPSVVLPPSWIVIPGLGSMVSTWREITGEREGGKLTDKCVILLSTIVRR